MLRLYRILLRLYPQDHRARFGDEMVSVFTQAFAERGTHGWLASASFLLREFAGVLCAASAERLRNAPFAPVGAIVVAVVLHGAFYSATAKVLRTISAAACRTELSLVDSRALADPRAAGLIAGLLGVVSLLCLLPVFFLLSIRLIRRRR